MEIPLKSNFQTTNQSGLETIGGETIAEKFWGPDLRQRSLAITGHQANWLQRVENTSFIDVD